MRRPLLAFSIQCSPSSPIDYSRTVFIDFGSGKGRTLLLASHYPFRSIIGDRNLSCSLQIAIDNVNGDTVDCISKVFRDLGRLHRN